MRTFRRLLSVLLGFIGLTATSSLVATTQAAALPSTPTSALPPQAAALKVDVSLRTELPASAERAAPQIDDAAYMRRACVDLIGRRPTPDELTAFVLDKSPDKRAKLVDRLLADPAFGVNWARYWRDVVLYRRAEDRALITQGVATEFLSQQLNDGASWADIATALITATGNLTESGSTVLIAAQMGDANEMASEVSRIFCGIQISCAQCHNHPTDRWKREQFHELAAYFPRVSVRPVLVDGRVRGFEAVSRDIGPRTSFLKDVANNPRFRPIEHYMPDLKDPSSQGTMMQPVFFATGEKLNEGSKDQDRRGALAQSITSEKNPWFARAYVNRVWTELVGRGFYEGVDDLGPDREPIAPKTLELLTAAFTRSGYDVKQFFRIVLATEVYARESRAVQNPDDPPFIANSLHRLRADQVYDAMVYALGLNISEGFSRGAYFNPRGLLNSPRAQVNQTLGYDPSVKRDEVAGSIPQALLLMNNTGLASAINGFNDSTPLGKLLKQTKNDSVVVTEMYLRALAREPNDREIEACLEYVKSVGNRVEAFEDIAWSLVNSTEFLQRM